MSTIRLTVETDDVSLDPDGPLGRVAALYRALLADGYDADLHTELDEDEPPDPAALN